MNQQHITVIHLTNVRVAHYGEDLMVELRAIPRTARRDGSDDIDKITGAKILDIRPRYDEVPLPELQSLLERAVMTEYREQVRAGHPARAVRDPRSRGSAAARL